MAIAGVIAAVVGAGAAVAGTVMAYQGQKKAQQANAQALDLQKQIEAKREQQMNLDAMRQKRAIVRQMLAARAASTSAGTESGAFAPGGSSQQGAYGSIEGMAGTNMVGVNQNQEIGSNIFGLNRSILGAYQSAGAGNTMSALGGGMASLGGALMQNEGAIGRVGTYLGTKGFNMAFGGGSPSGYGA